MADQNLQSYLERVKNAGMQPEEVRNILLNIGWETNQINNGIRQVYGINTPSSKNQKSPISRFETMRRILLFVIALRVLLFPIRYFLAPLQLTPESFSKYASLPFFGNIGTLGAILPLFWIFPFIGIIRRQWASYYIAILFGILLIYINIMTLNNIVASQLFYILSGIYFGTGLIIISISIKSLELFPKKEEVPMAHVKIIESRAIFVKIVVSLVFAITVILPGFLFPGGIIGSTLTQTEKLYAYSVALIVALLSGWKCADVIIEYIENSRKPGALGVLYGLINGAAAQLPLYGINPILIFAFPIGGFVGIIFGVIGISIIFYWTQDLLVKHV